MQIAHVRDWGAPFRTAEREEKGSGIPGGRCPSPAKGRGEDRRLSTSCCRQERKAKTARDGGKRGREVEMRR
jgi:hypothetical protein